MNDIEGQIVARLTIRRFLIWHTVAPEDEALIAW